MIEACWSGVRGSAREGVSGGGESVGGCES